MRKIPSPIFSFLLLLAELFKLNNDNIREIHYLDKALEISVKLNEIDLIREKLRKARE